MREETTVGVIEAILNRKSIRSYKTESVPRGILEEILKVAVRAPSAKNIQPWEITVVTGEVLEQLREANTKAFLSQEVPEMDVKINPTNIGIHRTREKSLGKQIFNILDIGRNDKQQKINWLKRGFRFFDAPVVIFLSADISVDPVRASSDIGGLAQTICLAAFEKNLGTCINRQGIMYPKAIKKIIELSDSQLLYICISMGYADPSFPVNVMQTEREKLTFCSKWHGFQPD